MFESLTNAEKRVLGRSAIGEASKEIADKLCLTVNTVNTHLNNIKEKVKDATGRTYKLAELRFLFLCETLGERSEEIKKIIISTTLSFAILFTTAISIETADRRRIRIRRRDLAEQTSEVHNTGLILTA